MATIDRMERARPQRRANGAGATILFGTLAVLGAGACSSGAPAASAPDPNAVTVTTRPGTVYADGVTTTSSARPSKTGVPGLGPTPAGGPTAGGGLPTAPIGSGGGHLGGGKGGGRGAKPGKGGGHSVPGSGGPVLATRWAVSPATIALPPGGHVSGYVVVKNLTGATGWVPAPGCAGPPHAASRRPTATRMCAPSGTPTYVEAGRTHTWEWSWNATSDGRSGSPPLAPGAYAFNIGGAIVHVTVG